MSGVDRDTNPAKNRKQRLSAGPTTSPSADEDHAKEREGQKEESSSSDPQALWMGNIAGALQGLQATMVS